MNPLAKYAEEEAERHRQMVDEFTTAAGTPHAIFQYPEGQPLGIWNTVNGVIAVVQRPDGKYDPRRATRYPYELIAALMETTSKQPVDL